MNKSKRIPPIVFILSLIGALVLGAIAGSILFGSDAGVIGNTPGDYFKVKINVPTGNELIPEDTMTISPSLTNMSNGPIYEFMRVEFDPSIYSFELDKDSEWKAVTGEDNLYAHAEGNTMISIAKNGSPSLTGTLTVIADAGSFSSVTAEDMKVTVTGYGIMTSVCSSAVDQAWVDYTNGGNQ